MPLVDEAVLVDQGGLAGAQGAGIDALSGGQVITFTLYRRAVLPLDGFVFWVRADQLNPGALLNGQALNSVTGAGVGLAPNQPVTIQVVADTLDVQPASLHHTTLNQQDEAESFSLQKFTLTCQQPVDVLNAIQPNELWVADWQNLKLAFSSRTGYYRAANTYHYSGDALYPALASQLIDWPGQLDPRQVVSNSLPVWLQLAQQFPLYPSYLVPDNISPPYGAIHIDEGSTDPLQAAPVTDPDTGSRYQLVRDRVKVTTYGVRNDDILDWINSVGQYTLDNPEVMGLMNVPVPRDAKRGQTEFSIIAQKKLIEFEVCYYQARVRTVALQYIKQALLSFIYAS